MAPHFSIDNSTDGGRVYSKFNAQILVGKSTSCILFFDLDNSIIVKFCHSTRFSSSEKISALNTHILHVFSLCSNSKMIWVATTPRTNARMENEFTGWYRNFIFRNPGDLMRTEGGLPALETDPKVSIPFFIFTGRPEPTIVGSFYKDFGPKTVLCFVAEYLRKSVRRYNLVLHNSVRLICATFPARQSAGTFDLNTCTAP